jgi:glycosyltransferase involved in cell wall biosynthesis
VKNSPRISVLTPTYDRAHTLGRLYASLATQTYRSFEWLVIDDGSTDGTERLVEAWISDGNIEIVYERLEHRGIHVAWNRGIELARGEFVTVVGSDDWLVPEGLELMLEWWNTIPDPDDDSFSGVVGLCGHPDGRVVGDRYPRDVFDCDPVELFHVHGIRGDKHSMLRRDVYREFPFPYDDDPSIKWVPSQLVWNRMALKYRERHVNRIVKVVDYQEEGLSARAHELPMSSPRPMRQYLLEELQLPHRLPMRRRVRSYANYVRFSLHARTPVRVQLEDAPSTLAYAAVAPLGLMLYVRDQLRLHGLVLSRHA